MSKPGPVVVMELPEHLTQAEAPAFLDELSPLLQTDRPRMVLDCSRLRHVDSAGVEMLLHCLQEAMKRDGDVKLAALPPESAIILELMRVDRLFEVFETTEQASRSFQEFGGTVVAPTQQPWYTPAYETTAFKIAS